MRLKSRRTRDSSVRCDWRTDQEFDMVLGRWNAGGTSSDHDSLETSTVRKTTFPRVESLEVPDEGVRRKSRDKFSGLVLTGVIEGKSEGIGVRYKG